MLGIFGFFFLFGFLHPNHLHPYREFFHDGFVALAIILAFTYLACSPRITLTFPFLIIFPAGLIGVIALQTLLGEVLFPIDSLFPIIYLVGFGLAIVFGATVASHEKGLEKLCVTLAVLYLTIGLLSVMLQQLQLFDIDVPRIVMTIQDREQLRPYANIAQPNMLAVILCCSLASIWWLYSSQRMRGWISLSFVLFLF